MRHFQQAKLQMKPLLLLVSQFAVRPQHDLKMRVRSSSPNNAATRSTRSRSSLETCSKEESLPAIFATVAFLRKRTIWRAKCVGLCPSLISWSTWRRISSLRLSDRLHHLLQNIRRRGPHQVRTSPQSRVRRSSDGLIEIRARRAWSRRRLGQHRQRIIVGLDVFAA